MTITITPTGAYLDGRKLAISLPDAALLGKPSLLSDRCVLCGSRELLDPPHHCPQKSRVPKRAHDLIPLLTLCRPCHGLAHKRGGIMEPYHDGDWWALLDSEAAESVTARGRAVEAGAVRLR